MSPAFHQTIKKGNLLLFLLCIIWSFFLSINPDKTRIWNYLYNIGYASIYLLGGITGVWYGMRFGLKTDAGKSFLLIACGLLSWSIGLVIWTYYNIALKIAVPYPSLSDVFFSILYFPPLTIGCLFLIRLFAPRIPARYYLDAFGITMVWGILVFVFFSRPDLSAELPFVTKFLNVMYPLGGVLLLSVAGIALRIYRGRIPTGLAYLTAGLLIKACADFLFSYLSATGVYWNGDISDIFYTAAGFAMCMGLVSTAESLTPEHRRS